GTPALGSATLGRSHCGLSGRVVFLRAPRALPCLARHGGLLAGALRFALGFFQALTRAFELLLGDAHALLGDVRLQPNPVEGLRRRDLFAACFLHLVACEAKRTVSLTQAEARFHPEHLSTEFVHNYVDRSALRAQTPSPGNGLRHGERVFATTNARAT